MKAACSSINSETELDIVSVTMCVYLPSVFYLTPEVVGVVDVKAAGADQLISKQISLQVHTLFWLRIGQVKVKAEKSRGST